MAYLTCLKCKVGNYVIKDYDYENNTLILIFVCNECLDERVLVIEFEKPEEEEERPWD